MPYGPSRKPPAPRSSRVPKMLGASKRGTHNHSIVPSGATSAPVWQSDRNAYSLIGGNGDAGASRGGASLKAGQRYPVRDTAPTMPEAKREPAGTLLAV